MTDHAQVAYAVITDWKMNSSGGYDAEMAYLEKSIADALTHAHAAGRREGLEEAAKPVSEWHNSKGGYSEMTWQIRAKAKE